MKKAELVFHHVELLPLFPALIFYERLKFGACFQKEKKNYQEQKTIEMRKN